MRVVFLGFADGTYHLFETDNNMRNRRTLEGVPPTGQKRHLIASVEAACEDTDEAFQVLQLGFEKMSSPVSQDTVRGRRVVLHGLGLEHEKYHLFSTDLDGRDQRTLDGNPNAWWKHKRMIAFLEAICEDSEEALHQLREGMEKVQATVVQHCVVVS